jgi:hypothetical protein
MAGKLPNRSTTFNFFVKKIFGPHIASSPRAMTLPDIGIEKNKVLGTGKGRKLGHKYL